jgi:hypothetical protein
MLFKEKSLREIFLGTKVSHTQEEHELAQRVESNFIQYRQMGSRKGDWGKVDPIHKGSGTVYLLPNLLGDQKSESLLLFPEHTKITQGPDLYVYLSPSDNPKEDYGEYLDLGLLKGNIGGQSYVIPQSIQELDKYKTVIIDCKQFSVLFTYAALES